jgi:hypothetical protein
MSRARTGRKVTSSCCMTAIIVLSAETVTMSSQRWNIGSRAGATRAWNLLQWIRRH